MPARSRLRFIPALLVSLLVTAGVATAATQSNTPPELVKTYASLADTILGAKQTEAELVRSILSAAYRHAETTLAKAKKKIESGNAREEIEALADLVSQLGNEGDAAVAGIRKRLLEGGHHHNAAGEQQGIYDEGFVVVTKAARKVFLDAASRIGKMAAAPDARALETEWQAVEKQYQALMKPAGR